MSADQLLARHPLTAGNRQFSLTGTTSLREDNSRNLCPQFALKTVDGREACNEPAL